MGGRICLAVGSSTVLGTGGSVVCERKDGSLQSLQSLLDLPQHNGSPNPNPNPHPQDPESGVQGKSAVRG